MAKVAIAIDIRSSNTVELGIRMNSSPNTAQAAGKITKGTALAGRSFSRDIMVGFSETFASRDGYG